MRRILVILITFIISAVTKAQGNTKTEDLSGLRANGKIWVVMAVCLTILMGLIIYLISLDRKIAKLEKGNK